MLFIATDLALKPYLFKLIIDFISNTQDPIGLFHEPRYIILLFTIIQMCVFIAWRIYFWCNLSYESLLKNTITSNLLNITFNHRYDFFEKKSPGNIVGHIRDIANYIPQINNIILTFTKTLWLSILSSVILLFIHPIFLTLFICWTISFISVPFFTLEKFYSTSTETATKYTKIYDTILDTVKNILPVSIFLGRHLELKKLENVQNEYLIVSKAKKSIVMKIYFLQGIMVVLYQLLCLSLLFLLHSQAKIAVGDFTLVLVINITLMANLWQTSEDIRIFNEYYCIVSCALSSLNIEKNILLTNKPKLNLSSNKILISNLEFSYKPHSITLSIPFLEIPPGQKVGIVGFSGSGKTTFAKLLMRFYDTNKGEIYISNSKISDIDHNTLMQAISFVPQEITVFNGSILDNIRYGNTNATDEEVITAAKKAQIHDYIQSLPFGYNTILGEDNIHISVGEKQRFAIARSLLKNSQIFIFDEHTSHQDSISEFLLKGIIDQFFYNKTILIIAHRLSVLENVDRILVFDSGRIIQDGEHSILLEQEGIYKQLWVQQLLK
jgi:ATP-binding cassette subfamily B protein